MGWICGTFRKEEKWKRDFGGETRGERSLRNLGAGGKIIFKSILKRCWRVLGWIHLGQNMDQCCGRVNVIVTFEST